MFSSITPEQAGISSRSVLSFLSRLERRGLTTHGILLMKGNQIFTECYWKPFHQNLPHRMYSQTKSFVSMAIGLLLEDGKLSLDDPISAHFPEKIDTDIPAELRQLTIRQMLTMSTAGSSDYWFTHEDPDRTHLYFRQHTQIHPAGTLWAYDSTGSQVLCNLAEKLAGKPLFTFLEERIFRHLGTFRDATILKLKNGDSWGDSSLLCTLRDSASFGRLLMQEGNWNGQQLISRDYVRAACARQVDNRQNAFGTAFSHGYGYQIWRTEQNGFALLGMGDQITLCLPDRDLLFAVVSDNQGYDAAREILVNAFFDEIADSMSPQPLPEDPEALSALQAYMNTLELRAVQGNADSPMRERISGKEYRCSDNDMGITRFSFVFHDAAYGELHYTNAQGDKVLPFGVNHNVFCKFPQFGYSGDVGTEITSNGSLYDAAVSLTWAQDNRILMNVQIIDRYLGNLSAVFGFSGSQAACRMSKTAENFLEEYNGFLTAERVD